MARTKSTAADRGELRSEPDAERAVIGALLLSAANGNVDCSREVFGTLRAGDFVNEDWRTLFSAAKRLHDREAPIDYVNWLAELTVEMSRDEAVVLLLEAKDSVATTAHAAHHAERIRDAARQRQLVCDLTDALNAAKTASHPSAVDHAAELASDALAEVRSRGTGGADIVCLADVEPEPIEWLWPNRIAIGKVTLVAGDPGLGKSMMTLAIASAVSRGAAWPDSPYVAQTPGGVVLLNAEDDLGDTIRPRLDSHEADCGRVVALKSLADLGRDLDQLRSAIERADNCRLVVVDPISAYMGRADSHVNAEVRAVLTPLAELAADKRVAILAVTHLRKGDGAAMYRAMGSLAFVAAARAAWAVVRDNANPRRRLMLAVKNNLAADVANGLAYTIEPHGADGGPVVCWEREPVTITADEALTPETRGRGRPADERQDAEAWLRGALANGPRPARDVTNEAVEGHCIAKRTLDRARKAVGVVAYRDEPRGPWWWKLPDVSECHPSEPPAPTQEFWHSGNLSDPPADSDEFVARNVRLPELQTVGAKAESNGRAG